MIDNEFRTKDLESLTNYLNGRRIDVAGARMMVEIEASLDSDSLYEIADRNETLPAYLKFIKILATYLIFFNDDETRLAFKKVGLGKPTIQKWLLLDHKRLLAEIDKINNAGEIYVEYFESFKLVKEYLESKVLAALINDFYSNVEKDYDGRRNLTAASKEIMLFIERFKHRSGGDAHVKFWEQPLFEIFTEWSGHENEKFVRKFMMDYCEGKTERYYISTLLTYCVHKVDPNVSDRRRCLLLFDLIKLICKDSNIKDEDEFNSDDDVTYGSKYDDYKIGIVKVIRKKSFKF